MYRAIIFDFYGVWAPDNFSLYVQRAEQLGPEVAAGIQQTVHDYFLGLSDIQEVVDSISYKFKVAGFEVHPEELILNQQAASQAIIQFIQYLHGHFLKVGVIANLGRQEHQLLEGIQSQYDLFDTLTGADALGLPILSPEVFAKALQDIGEPPEDCLAISGDPEYIKFAAQVGMATLPFAGFPKMQASLKEMLEGGAQPPAPA